jgi:ABC transport permease subunit
MHATAQHPGWAADQTASISQLQADFDNLSALCRGAAAGRDGLTVAGRAARGRVGRYREPRARRRQERARFVTSCRTMAHRINVAVASLAAVGGRALDALAGFGRFWVFVIYAISFLPLELATFGGWRRLLPQAYAIGTRSVPVLMLTGTFVGMVLVVQAWAQFEAAGLADYLGVIVNTSVVKELGPVLAGVMLAGRVGGALTAELGTMNVTEQLLALRSMGADPVRYLVAPRFLACLLLTPLLTVYADLMGALGSWVVNTGV